MYDQMSETKIKKKLRSENFNMTIKKSLAKILNKTQLTLSIKCKTRKQVNTKH